MRFLLQRCSTAAVEIAGQSVARIAAGYLVLLGLGQGDTKADADFLIRKLLNLRVFEDEQGKMNLSIRDIGGELLLVSQFTLYADTTHGNRPGFTGAMPPQQAEPLYRYIVQALKQSGVPVQTGEFGADMAVSLVNDGPVTIMLEHTS